jgi:hypothetical protein
MTDLYLTAAALSGQLDMAAGAAENASTDFALGTGQLNEAKPEAAGIYVECGTMGGTTPSIVFTAYTSPLGASQRVSLGTVTLSESDIGAFIDIIHTTASILGSGVEVEAVCDVANADETYLEVQCALCMDGVVAPSNNGWTAF